MVAGAAERRAGTLQLVALIVLASSDKEVPWAPSNYTLGRPLRFVDKGGPSGLGSTNVSAQGAVFIGNIGHDETFVGTVLIESSVKNIGNTKQGNSIYFLEGSPALLDQAG